MHILVVASQYMCLHAESKKEKRQNNLTRFILFIWPGLSQKNFHNANAFLKTFLY